VFSTKDFRGRDFITLLDYTREEIEFILDFSAELKDKFKSGRPHKYLEDKTLFMIFYNSSLRTRNSFEAGMTQMGGHAHFLDPNKIYLPDRPGACPSIRLRSCVIVILSRSPSSSMRTPGKFITSPSPKTHFSLRSG